MSTFIVDTHALVWYLDEDKKLSKNAGKILDSSDVTLVILTEDDNRQRVKTHLCPSGYKHDHRAFICA